MTGDHSAQPSLQPEADPVPSRPRLRVVHDARGPAHRVVVIGGGIAGLSAAHELMNDARHPVHVTVLEGSGQVGGKLRVSEVAGVPLDEGAEAMQAARPEAVGLARAVGLDRDIVHPEVFGASLWVRGKLRQMPPTVMGVPTDLRALTASGILPLQSVLRLPMEYGRRATRFDTDVSVGAYVESRLGREVVDTIVEPVLGGVYAGRADALSMAATLPVLLRELRTQPSLLRAAESIARGGGRRAGARRGPVFAGVRGGVGRMPDAVADDIRILGGEVRTDSPVRSLHRLDDHWRIIVSTADGQDVIEAEDVVLAVPPPQASDLLTNICPPASTDLGLIPMASMATISVAYPADAVGPLNGSGFLVPPTQGRTIKACTYSSSKWDWIARAARTRQNRPDAKVVLRASVGRTGTETLRDMDDDSLLATVHQDLVDAIHVTAPPIDSRVTRWNDGIPQYATGHVQRIERIRNAVAGVSGLEVCGAAFDGVGVAAVIGSARHAARNVQSRLTAAAVPQ